MGWSPEVLMVLVMAVVRKQHVATTDSPIGIEAQGGAKETRQEFHLFTYLAATDTVLGIFGTIVRGLNRSAFAEREGPAFSNPGSRSRPFRWGHAG